jgi:endonuclease-3
MTAHEKAAIVIERLGRVFPHPQTELHHSNPYQLAVAVVLSAQCTDKRVNRVTPAFFERFADFDALSRATPTEIYEVIKSVSYPNNKSKHLAGMAKIVVEKHGGQLPATRAELQALPGVGRKTANVLLSILYGMPTLAVDTHVFRVSRRIGLADGKTPAAVEKRLVELISPHLIPAAHHLLILHGRYVCTARKPQCASCVLADLCQYFQDHPIPNP